MPSIQLDNLRCPSPCKTLLTVEGLRVHNINGVHAGTEATLVCSKCGLRHPVCDAEQVETVQFKMFVALGLSLVLGLPAAYFGTSATDSTVQVVAGLASLALLGWSAYALVVFVSARGRTKRFASLIEASGRA
jgi:hypothetical protein